MTKDLLRIKGIGPKNAKLLVNAGIDSIDQIANSSPKDLAFVKGIGVVSAQKMIDNAKYLLQFERGLSIVLDTIQKNFASSCPKCGGDMEKKFIIINPTTRISANQCKLCKFYLPA